MVADMYMCSRSANKVVETGTKKIDQICQGCGKGFINLKLRKRYCKCPKSVISDNTPPL